MTISEEEATSIYHTGQSAAQAAQLIEEVVLRSHPGNPLSSVDGYREGPKKELEDLLAERIDNGMATEFIMLAMMETYVLGSQ